MLSWDDIVEDIEHPEDGYNVILHEFAHQLDSEWGNAEGAPTLTDHSHYVAWARVLGLEFENLNLTVSQKIGDALTLKFQAKNLTDPAIETAYRYRGTDLTRTKTTKGIDFTIGLNARFNF